MRASEPRSPTACSASVSTTSTPPSSRVTAADVPMPYAKTLETAYLPQPERVAEAVRQALYR